VVLADSILVRCIYNAVEQVRFLVVKHILGRNAEFILGEVLGYLTTLRIGTHHHSVRRPLSEDDLQ
jgi:hypothetical protein